MLMVTIVARLMLSLKVSYPLGFVFLVQVKLPLPQEVYKNYSINHSLMSQRKEKYSCRKGRNILCQAECKAQTIHLFKHLARSQKEQRKPAPPEECLAAPQRRKEALQILCSGDSFQHKATLPFNSPPKHKRKVPRAHPWQAKQPLVCPPDVASRGHCFSQERFLKILR